MKPLVVVVVLAGCAGAGDPAREQVVVAALADDNYESALRDPDLVGMKLRLMQETPYAWLRGTARLYWNDLMAVGTARSGGGDAASSRVLLLGDPHPENLGSFRLPDATLVVDWDDFDAAGYGPFEGDLRRLGAGMIVATGNAETAKAAAEGYAAQIADLAAGKAVVPVGLGDEPYLDDLLAKAKKKGDADDTLDEVAPVTDGVRQMAFGDIDPVDDHGVVQKRLAPVSAEQAAWIDAAIAQWNPQAHVVGRARRFGAGVASYPLYRFYVLLDGDVLVEVKEERDGLIVDGVPKLASAEWASPARRVVDAQRRLNARPDEDDLLGAADLGGLSLRIHALTAYQRGVDSEDLADLDAAEQVALAHRFGTMLARAHGQALTADGVPGWTVLAPFTSGAFADDVAALAQADAAQILDDYNAFADRDLAALVLPLVKD
jgi:uncharacterized protein (DUF2252 family)